MQENFGLADGDFFDFTPERAAGVTRVLASERQHVVALAAPREISLDAEQLPVLVGAMTPFDKASTYSVAERAVLVDVELDRGLVLASPLNDDPDRIPFDSGPSTSPPTGASVGARTASVYPVDLHERIEWERGRHLLTVLVLDKVSNRVRIDLVPPPGQFDDPAVRSFIEAERIRVGPPSAGPLAREGEDLPSYGRRPESPEPPKEHGFAMTAPRVVVVPGTCVIHGSFRLPLAPHQVVPLERREAEGGAAAVVGVTLILVSSASPDPVAVYLLVPVYGDIPPSEPPKEVTGYFAMDLFAEGALSPSEQTYFVYAFAGEVMAAPVPIGLVPRDRLPH